MPIVIVNRSYARTMKEFASASENASSSTLACSCGVSPECSERAYERYFLSQDYNAGRHASTQSKHKASCAMWQPPSTGHLHSWRRGFTEPELTDKSDKF